MQETESDDCMSWFGTVFGFEEDDYRKTQELLRARLRQRPSPSGESELCIEGAGGRALRIGDFAHDSLAALRAKGREMLQSGCCRRTEPSELYPRVRNVSADVADLHRDPSNAGALFQAASQLNCLEFVHYTNSPEQGITRYQHDHTQGPACAIACAAGTAYRNYLVEVGGQVGQTKAVQLDGFQQVTETLSGGCPQRRADYYDVRGGYVLSDDVRLKKLSERLADADLRKRLGDMLRIGVHYNTAVTASGAQHCVGQAYCAACAIGYSMDHSSNWEPLATLVQDAAYEATLWSAVVQAVHHARDQGRKRADRVRVFLTKLGAGVFGNPDEWVVAAIRKMLAIAAEERIPLDVSIVHYGRVTERYCVLNTGTAEDAPAAVSCDSDEDS